VEAVSELWPLITRLEVRLSGGHAEHARAAAESGDADLFDTVAGQCVEALNADEGHQVFFNAFTVREVSIRGLLATGRTGQAVDLAERFAPAKLRRLRSGESSSRRLKQHSRAWTGG